MLQVEGITGGKLFLGLTDRHFLQGRLYVSLVAMKPVDAQRSLIIVLGQMACRIARESQRRSKHGAGPIIVHKMSADGRQLLDDGVTVYTGPVAEGTKFLKRNGFYYLVIPEGGVGQGWPIATPGDRFCLRVAVLCVTGSTANPRFTFTADLTPDEVRSPPSCDGRLMPRHCRQAASASFFLESAFNFK